MQKTDIYRSYKFSIRDLINNFEYNNEILAGETKFQILIKKINEFLEKLLFYDAQVALWRDRDDPEYAPKYANTDWPIILKVLEEEIEKKQGLSAERAHKIANAQVQKKRKKR